MAMRADLEEHLDTIATPLTIGLHLGRPGMGVDFESTAHLEYIEDRVMDAVLDPEPRFVAISAPPRHGKTWLLGRLLPLWYIGHFPEHQVMYASYGEDRSSTEGAWVRGRMEKYGRELFGYQVDRAQAKKTQWKLVDHDGGMLAVGRGGPILGEPGHLILVDDLFKGPQDAASMATRKMVKEWFHGVLRARLEPGGTIIVFFQRWAIDDLIGDLKGLAQAEGFSGDTWEFINLPALADPLIADPPVLDAGPDWRDELGRKAGEALWPRRYTEQQLARLRGNDPINFRTIYQGDPRAGTGGWFPEEKWTRMPLAEMLATPMVQQCRVWDLAATEHGGDWTVGMKLGRDAANNLYVLDVWRDRKAPETVEQRVRSTAESDGNHVTVLIEQERQGSGKTVLSVYKRRLVGYSVEPAHPDGKKAERAKPANEYQGMGRCIIPRNEDADWVPKFVAELSAFERQKVDDQVDTFAYGFRKLIAEAGISTLVTGDRMWDELERLEREHNESAGVMRRSGLLGGRV